MIAKHTQAIPSPHLKHLLAVARGDKEPDFVLKNVTILDLIEGDSYLTNIAFYDRWIAGLGTEYQASCEEDVTGLTAVPGFIDAHIHIESTLMHPFEFERATLPLGTTTVICDPHELANVLGKDGIDWILRCASTTQQNLFIQVPSCVPSLPDFETNNSFLKANDIADYRDHPHVLGLAEMMNYPGAIHGDQDILEKLEMFGNYVRDGHAPQLRGQALNAYRALGIENCHESISHEEALEKLRLGMAVMIREGSVARNLNTLAPLVSEFNSPQCLLCSDDRNPYELQEKGHINELVRSLILDHHIPPHVAYRLSSYSAAKHFGLKRLGLIAPGYQADIVLLRDVHSVEIEAVYCAGKKISPISPQETYHKFIKSAPPLSNSIQRQPLNLIDFSLPLADGILDVIEVIPNEIVTNHLQIPFDNHRPLTDLGINKIAVIERYGHQSPIKPGLVKGFNLMKGAIASSVAHDSHNIVVIGADDRDMAFAVNHLIKAGGGFIAVHQEQIDYFISLPIAGLISQNPVETIYQDLVSLKQACRNLGISLEEPFLQMAFLALPVIPSLKITDKGVLDVTNLTFIEYKQAA
jgi:adenine deaminase